MLLSLSVKVDLGICNAWKGCSHVWPWCVWVDIVKYRATGGFVTLIVSAYQKLPCLQFVITHITKSLLFKQFSLLILGCVIHHHYFLSHNSLVNIPKSNHFLHLWHLEGKPLTFISCFSCSCTAWNWGEGLTLVYGLKGAVLHGRDVWGWGLEAVAHIAPKVRKQREDTNVWIAFCCFPLCSLQDSSHGMVP